MEGAASNFNLNSERILFKWAARTPDETASKGPSGVRPSRAPLAAHLSNVTTNVNVRATSLPKTKFTVVSGYPCGEKQENFGRKLAYFLPVRRRKVVKPSDALSRSASGAIAASTAARRGLICPDDVVFAITSPDNARRDETCQITSHARRRRKKRSEKLC